MHSRKYEHLVGLFNVLSGDGDMFNGADSIIGFLQNDNVNFVA